MKCAAKPQEQPPRPACAPHADRTERRDDAPGPRCDQAERFRATARHTATQIDIEAAMWRILDREPER